MYAVYRAAGRKTDKRMWPASEEVSDDRNPLQKRSTVYIRKKSPGLFQNRGKEDVLTIPDMSVSDSTGADILMSPI